MDFASDNTILNSFFILLYILIFLYDLIRIALYRAVDGKEAMCTIDYTLMSLSTSLSDCYLEIDIDS